MTKGMFKLNKTFSRVLNEENTYSFSAEGSKDTYKIELFKNETNNYLLRKDEEYYKITYTTLPEEEVGYSWNFEKFTEDINLYTKINPQDFKKEEFIGTGIFYLYLLYLFDTNLDKENLPFFNLFNIEKSNVTFNLQLDFSDFMRGIFYQDSTQSLSLRIAIKDKSTNLFILYYEVNKTSTVIESEISDNPEDQNRPPLLGEIKGPKNPNISNINKGNLKKQILITFLQLLLIIGLVIWVIILFNRPKSILSFNDETLAIKKGQTKNLVFTTKDFDWDLEFTSLEGNINNYIDVDFDNKKEKENNGIIEVSIPVKGKENTEVYITGTLSSKKKNFLGHTDMDTIRIVVG